MKDVNDNAPRFWRDQYESFLPENSNAFETPLVIQAEDRDENGWSSSLSIINTIMIFHSSQGPRWKRSVISTHQKSSVAKFLLAGTGNAMVRYRIVEGDTTGNFSIDSVTGEVGWIQL